MAELAEPLRALGISDMVMAGIDPRSGLGEDYLAIFRNRKQSVAQELGLGKGRAVDVAPPRQSRQELSGQALYDKQMEARGWYRTVRAAAILKCNPLWLAYACHVGIIKGRKKSTDLFLDQYRVRLDQVREWMKTL